jgi:hypothetical protein
MLEKFRETKGMLVNDQNELSGLDKFLIEVAIVSSKEFGMTLEESIEAIRGVDATEEAIETLQLAR